MSIDESWFRKEGETPEEYQRRLSRSKVSRQLKARYLNTREHDLILRIARKLNLVAYWFTFTEENNSCLYIAYDFYLSPSRWFQILVTWNEDNSVNFMFYDAVEHYFCDPNNIEELIEKIEKAQGNPKTYQLSAS